MIKERLKLTDSTFAVAVKMSDGNPGAIQVIMQVLSRTDIDPDSALGGMGAILHLDSMGIYGTDIYVLFNDICNRELSKFIAVLRACQLGFESDSKLADACSRQDGSGAKMIDVDGLYQKVIDRLPDFDKQGITS